MKYYQRRPIDVSMFCIVDTQSKHTHEITGSFQNTKCGYKCFILTESKHRFFLPAADEASVPTAMMGKGPRQSPITVSMVIPGMY